MTTDTPAEAHAAVVPMAALYAALAAAQGEMRHAAKDATNPHFRNRYATLASCLDAIREPFSHHGLAVVQEPGFDDGRVTVTTIIVHAAGGSMASTVSARPAKDTPQALGSCITYLRRYALCAVVGIASDDDDGNTASRAPTRTEPIPPAPTATIAEVRAAAYAAAPDFEQGDVDNYLDSIGCDRRSPEGRALLVESMQESGRFAAALESWLDGGAA